MRALEVQSRALGKMLERMAPEHSAEVEEEFRTLAVRYGPLLEEALLKHGSGPDIIWFGVIDWDFRIQRPQHLAMRLADLGSRVFYVSIVFEAMDKDGRFRIIRSVYPGVFELRLKLAGPLPENIYGGFTPDQIAELRASLDEVLLLLHLRSLRAVVQYPSWLPVITSMPGVGIVHDCLDLISGFSNVPPDMLRLEEKLVEQADAIVVPSQPLAEHVATARSCVVIRNGADVKFFSDGAQGESVAVADRLPEQRPIIGYFGALSHWFEIDWIEDCARCHPDWTFEIVGSLQECDTTEVQYLPNVRLLGEQPYASLPDRLSNWNVAIIPFKLLDLIKCTNPVKLYEYMAAGKPVVASAMPEVVQATDLVYIAKDALDFGRQIERALNENTPELAELRREWSRQHDWWSRAFQFRELLDRLRPKVSIVILCFNNLSYTEACINSVLTLSDYENLQIIVVDNASIDETSAYLRRLAAYDSRVKVILNDENLGFAAGNNVGIRAATGDYVILLNNDIYVTRGWISDLIRPLQLDPTVGMAGPLTNNIGNEQKVKIAYTCMTEMQEKARMLVRRYPRRCFFTSGLAFFCVAIRREAIENVGLLDESYTVGFFEDDDYCRRVAAAGYKLVIADDVFVHHRLSASFDALGAARKKELMEHNRAVYESKWGTWIPHRYRDEAGFG